MPKHSAGLLLYRRRKDTLDVFLVHPGGPFWKNKDAHAWSIPKGEFDPETEDALAAARREFAEETGQTAPTAPDPHPLEPVRTSRKINYAFAQPADFEPTDLRSNSFSLEWPPRSGQHQDFPEVDAAAWFALPDAYDKILESQRPLLDQLTRLLSES
jgi:predicted NUDIX family NTP pyrophosphohydrolase